MTENLEHPAAERLEAFVEETLDAGERASLDAHLAACAACRAEVSEMRSLFAALASLPEMEPSPGFANRVMARVRVRQPALSRASAWAGSWVERLAPKTTRGWAAASAVFSLPVLGASLLVLWLMAQPGVSAQGLWTVTSGLAASAASSAWQWSWIRIANSGLAATAVELFQLVASVGRGGIGLGVVMFATLTAGSVYVLYQNLFRTTPRRNEHASYVF